MLTVISIIVRGEKDLSKTKEGEKKEKSDSANILPKMAPTGGKAGPFHSPKVARVGPGSPVASPIFPGVSDEYE